MSPNTMATLIILSVLVVATIGILVTVAYKFRRTWTAATQGRHLPPALTQLVISMVLSFVLFNTAFDPPFPISWNEPVRCTMQTCVWEHYYVLLIITLVLLTLAAVATVLALLCTVAWAIITAPAPADDSSQRPLGTAAAKETDSHV